MANNNSKPTKGAAYTQPAVIKAKSKWTKKTTTWLIVIVVIILAILAIIGSESGWFKSKDMINGKVELDDYSVIDVNSSDLKASDASVNAALDNIANTFATTETVTEGTVENGDTIEINYTGKLEGDDEAFEGGTAENSVLTLGSGQMIDGFESQIEGHKIGETFDITVTFPEDYQAVNVAGKNATFTITINSKKVTTVPELTDDMVKEYSAANMSEPVNTIDEFVEQYKADYAENALENAIMSAMLERTHVIYYNEADLAMMKNYSSQALSYYSSMYGMDANLLASLYGFESVADYVDNDAKNTLQTTMMLDKVAEEQGITMTDEEIDARLIHYMEEEGHTGETLDEFKAESGPEFLFIVTKTEVLLPKVVEFLKNNNVNIIETAEEETEAAVETEAAETEVAETEAAETEAPETEVPETEAAETEAPETEAPEAETTK